ncbi:MAG: hypothetical protein ACOYME_10725 [Prochlorotrichaceae cyanobacterium]
MEYQYYEFQAIDRPLNQTEQNDVQSLSSRVRLTATQAIFTYSYGDFRGEPLSVLENYFDAMLYMANWGSYHLAFRFPKSAVNLSALQLYCVKHIIEVTTVKKYVILNIKINEEEGSCWIEDDNNWLSLLIPLRQSILQEDYRILYLAWLQAASHTSKKDLQEPPIPPNLQKLNSPLQAFTQWLQIDPDLITIAAQASRTQKERQEPFKDWIKALSEQEKTELLLEIVTSDLTIASQLQARLRQRFSQTPEPLAISEQRRSYAHLKALAETERLARKAREEEAATRERHQYLESLKPEQEGIWKTIDSLISRKKSQFYDEAVQHLINLRDLATLEGNTVEFQRRLQQIQTTYSKCPGLLRRIDAADLLNC